MKVIVKLENMEDSTAELNDSRANLSYEGLELAIVIHKYAPQQFTKALALKLLKLLMPENHIKGQQTIKDIEWQL